MPAFDWTAIHHDTQGSVRGVTGATGTKVERTVYRPFGNPDTTLTWTRTLDIGRT